jgi:hypothetical protein
MSDAQILEAAANVVRRRAPKPDSFGARLITRFLENMAAKLREMDK